MSKLIINCAAEGKDTINFKLFKDMSVQVYLVENCMKTSCVVISEKNMKILGEWYKKAQFTKLLMGE